MNDRPLLDVAALRAEMNLNSHEIELRKASLGFDDDDVKLLDQIDALVDPHVDDIVDVLAAEFNAGGDVVSPTDEQGRRALRHYFGGLTSAGGMDDAFVDRRLTMVSALRQFVTPDIRWYLSAYRFYLNEVAKRMRELPADLTSMQAMYRTLSKVLFFDLSLAIDCYLFERDRTIRAQQQELKELSTPVLQLRPGLLLIPIIGLLDTRRAQQLTDQLLQAIRDRRGKVVVLDVTGAAAVDSRVANHVIEAVNAAGLMGATAIVTGVSPEVAEALVDLGIRLDDVTTVTDLQDGIEEANRLLDPRW